METARRERNMTNIKALGTLAAGAFVVTGAVLAANKMGVDMDETHDLRSPANVQEAPAPIDGIEQGIQQGPDGQSHIVIPAPEQPGK
jgi:hypothetical protein